MIDTCSQSWCMHAYVCVCVDMFLKPPLLNDLNCTITLSDDCDHAVLCGPFVHVLKVMRMHLVK